MCDDSAKINGISRVAAGEFMAKESKLKEAAWSVVGKVFMKTMDTAEQMTPQAAYEEIQQGQAVLVDVREREETLTGMAEPARWIATSSIEMKSPEWDKFVEQLPRDKRIVLYCAAGVRSGRAASELASKGFKTANIGGFKDWVAAKLPVRKP